MRVSRTSWLFGGGAVLALAVAGLGAGHRHGHSSHPTRAVQAVAPALPAPVRPAFTPRTPPPLRDGSSASWAPVLRAVAARAQPAETAREITTVGPRTPEGTANVVLVLGRRVAPGGEVWVKVSLAVLPNGTTGWVPRAALGGYVDVGTRLVVDLQRFTATLLAHGRRVFEAPVGVGKPEWPTPRGTFYIRDRLAGFDDPTYGPVAFGTSARSAVLTDWPAGGYVGIHGTNEPQLIPGRISHGCIRLRNRDILRLSRLMPVGTPVTIR